MSAWREDYPWALKCPDCGVVSYVIRLWMPGLGVRAVCFCRKCSEVLGYWAYGPWRD